MTQSHVANSTEVIATVQSRPTDKEIALTTVDDHYYHDHDHHHHHHQHQHQRQHHHLIKMNLVQIFSCLSVFFF